MKPHHILFRDVGVALIVTGILELMGFIPVVNAYFGIPPGVLIMVVGGFLFFLSLKGGRRR